MNISQQKSLFRNICKLMGHVEGKKRCSRCKKILFEGFVAWEMIGMTIFNATGITKIELP